MWCLKINSKGKKMKIKSKVEYATREVHMIIRNLIL